MAFDLDPSDEDFSAVTSTARSLKDLLDALQLPAYLKTTGSRGLHIIVPLDARHDFDEVRAFSREIAARIVAEEPDRRTLEILQEQAARKAAHRHQPQRLRADDCRALLGAGSKRGAHLGPTRLA